MYIYMYVYIYMYISACSSSLGRWGYWPTAIDNAATMMGLTNSNGLNQASWKGDVTWDLASMNVKKAQWPFHHSLEIPHGAEILQYDPHQILSWSVAPSFFLVGDLSLRPSSFILVVSLAAPGHRWISSPRSLIKYWISSANAPANWITSSSILDADAAGVFFLAM